MDLLTQNQLKRCSVIIIIVFLFISNNILAQERTNVPDDAFEQSLIDQNLDDVLDDYVLTANIENLTLLNISNKGIADLTGIEDFTNLSQLLCHENSIAELNINSLTKLERLLCFDNQLTSLDLQQNGNLTEVFCDKNQIARLDLTRNSNLLKLKCDSNPIKNLDLSQNTSLTHLYVNNMLLNHLDLSNNPEVSEVYCGNNVLPMLDLSQNVALTKVYCSDNELEYLNIKNGNNTNISYFKSTGNTALACISVDDVNYSSSNWNEIDSQTNFSVDCPVFDRAYLGDSDNLELLLIDCGYDDIEDGYVLKSNIESIKSLNLGWDGSISAIDGQYCGLPDYGFSMKNIDNFPSLESLSFGGIPETRIDLSALTELKYLSIVEPFLLNDLDLSKNTKLTFLYIESAGELKNLDLSNNVNLETLIFEYDYIRSPIESLDLSNNIQLRELVLYQIDLINLDLTKNSNLETLDLDSPINTLDLSENQKLFQVRISGNDLSSLNLNNNNNQKITDLDVNYESLTCFQVDDANWSATNWNSFYTYSENCYNLIDDSDGDGVANNLDICQNTPAGEQVDANGCSASQALSVAAQEFDQSLKIYPNPITSNFTIEAGDILIEKTELFTPLGQKIDKIMTDYDQIETNDLARGIYILKISSEKGTAVRRIIKQ